jgi:uncharacterized protein with GYD domain
MIETNATHRRLRRPPREERRVPVATYVLLINWTEQGIKEFKESPKRAKAFMDAAKAAGGRTRALYWTLGPYDMVAVVDAPDDETLTALALRVGALGNVRTTTLRAFDEAAFRTIVKKAS